MNELLNCKIEKAKELKAFTLEILSFSLTTDYMKVESIFDNRQALIDEINKIDEQIKEINLNYDITEAIEIKEQRRELRIIFKEVSELDNIIRNKLNDEIKNVRKNLNKPESPPRLLNLKA